MDTNMSIHPGEILLEEFLKPYNLTPSVLAARLGIAPNRITTVVRGDRSITTKTAVLLAEAFGTTPQFWINLQMHYDLEQAKSSMPPASIERARTLHRELECA